MDDELHQRAVDIAKRILAGSQTERYELGVAEPNEDSRLFSDLVELAKQLLREEELRGTYRTPPNTRATARSIVCQPS